VSVPRALAGASFPRGAPGAWPNRARIIQVDGFFDDLGNVAKAIGSGAASAIVHTVNGAEHFIGNAVKAAGREVGRAVDSLVSIEHDITSAIARIPFVGGPLSMFLDAAFHAAVGPMTTCLDVILKGKRIDEALLAHLQTTLQDFKDVGPYVQMVVGVVPGVGTACSMCIGMGLALANGQPIDQVLLAGVSGAIPGGPLAKAAVNLAYAGIHSAATGGHLDLAQLGTMAMSSAAGALGLPPAATNALTAGVTMCGQLCAGAPLDKALSSAVVNALPLPANAKQALTECDAIALDLAHGKRLDKALLSRVGNVATYLPNIDPQLRAQLANVARTGASLASGASPEQALGAALRNGAADSLIAMGTRSLPPAVGNALTQGLALGNGVMHQARKVEALISGGFPDKLAQMGQQFAQAHPAVAAARKIVSPGELRGFDIGQGLTAQTAKLFELTAVRNALKDSERKGFDTALAHRIGLVAHPVPTHLSPEHQAGHAIALGIATQHPANKQSIMATVASNGAAAAGAALAMQRKPCSATTAAAFRATCMQGAS